MIRILFLIAGVVILLGLFLILKPASGNSSSELRSFKYSVKGGKVTTGPAVIRVREGEKVEIEVLVDRDEELHLHGRRHHPLGAGGLHARLRR